MNKRTSVVWKVGREEFQKIIDESHSIVSVLERLGLQTKTGNHRTVKKRILEDGISLDKFQSNKKIFIESSRRREKVPICNILVEKSSYPTSKLKDRLVKEGILEYKCSKCGNDGNWMGETLSLHLEHKNGINNDNRLENVCILCPNCHSQTKTYSGKSNKKIFFVNVVVESTKSLKDVINAQNYIFRQFLEKFQK